MHPENQKLHLLFIKIELQNNIQNNLKSLASLVLSDFNEKSPFINKSLFSCISQLPFKSNVYATLVALINLDNPEIAFNLIAFLHQNIISAIHAGNWNILKIMIRFYAQLVYSRTASIDSLFAIYMQLLDHDGLKIQEADCLVYILVASLPFVGSFIHATRPDLLHSLMLNIAQHMQKRESIYNQKLESGHVNSSTINALKIYKVTDDSILGYNQHDQLSDLYIQILNLESSNWQFNLLERTSDLFTSQLESQTIVHYVNIAQSPTITKNIKLSKL